MQKSTILRSEVKGWGADLDENRRPASRREANQETVLSYKGDDYEKVPRQLPRVEILLSSEHQRFPPIFGTTCPPKGFSGMLRRWAFRWSEGKKAHWLTLMLADRIDVFEGLWNDWIHKGPFYPFQAFQEMGLGTELKRQGFLGRFGHYRADTKRWGRELMFLTGLMGTAWIVSKLKKQAEKEATYFSLP